MVRWDWGWAANCFYLNFPSYLSLFLSLSIFTLFSTAINCLVNCPTRWSLYCPLGICIDHPNPDLKWNIVQQCTINCQTSNILFLPIFTFAFKMSSMLVGICRSQARLCYFSWGGRGEGMSFCGGCIVLATACWSAARPSTRLTHLHIPPSNISSIRYLWRRPKHQWSGRIIYVFSI